MRDCDTVGQGWVILTWGVPSMDYRAGLICVNDIFTLGELLLLPECQVCARHWA